MPFIPHTQEDVQSMLSTIGVESLDALFDEIPTTLRSAPPRLPPPLKEMAISRLMRERAGKEGGALAFLGAGAYEHHIPAAVWEIAGRGEFYSAYTPYQAEASQGTLQLLYEYQTMIAGLTGMDLSNASLYDGASATAEAVLMAVRCSQKQGGCVGIPATVNPRVVATIRTLVSQLGIELVEIESCPLTGAVDWQRLAGYPQRDWLALLIPQPNYFGVLEEVDALTNWGHAQGALVIGVVNPLSLGVLKPPGEWGEKGADLVCGEGQPLGIPLSSGGPYLGFLACQTQWTRQLPGRIVGRTEDRRGQVGFVLTLQAREQHIRRAKATSNICTNQGLMTVAATLYLALLGPTGLARVATACHHNSKQLQEKLTGIVGVEKGYDGPFFHEFVLQLARPVESVLAGLFDRGIIGGLALASDRLLVCCTETKTEQDRDRYAQALEDVMKESGG
ncbi:MAG: aminomethyl-transferring glycine dehydrogenase subunit GcvPA [Magnetococcales bacterium]|nr:aminomethyl-transferring glycine dehydrogenase subunit GcvPA [Magnetococcales bacterium]